MLFTIKLLFFGAATTVAYVVLEYFRHKRSYAGSLLPSFAAITPLWFSYKTSTGQRFRIIDDLHRKLTPSYGSHQSMSHSRTPGLIRTFTATGSPILKDQFYLHAAGGNPSIAQTTSKEEHTRKRRALAHVFSAKEIIMMEPRVLDIIHTLCADTQIKSEGNKVL
ncbi:hypothetical protein VUR80DRAFT_3333 [Thermomyces stellatus]